MIYIIVAIVGLLAGVLVNALADDLPMRRRLRVPHYPDDTPRPISAWSGILAFALGKRTSPGGAQLSWRYPLTELLTAGLMVAAVSAAQSRADVSALQIAFWLAYMAILTLITVIDVEHKLILFVVIIPSAVIALVDALLTPDMARPTLGDALIGGVAGFIVFFVLYNGGFLFTYLMGNMRGQPVKEVAFGYGDVMLATVSGLMLGWAPLILAMFITVFLGAFGALLYIVSRRFLRQRYSAFTALPYGPYIVIGTLLLLLYPLQVSAWFGAIWR
ncbi:MAG: prepilin peptidase [Armatimonadetes bacterium]|nr:prepilin peptidase [Anaerolineae bacterium]